MRFFRRQRYLLCVLAVLVFCCVMVVSQYLANESAHLERREDFILLHERADPAETKFCEHVYQDLIQEFPRLSDKILLDDLERTSWLVNPKVPDLDNLVWKYHISVSKELQKRSSQRLARALARAAKP